MQLIVRALPTSGTSTNLNDWAKPLTVLDAQIALDRLGFSCGSVDGVLGSQTRCAIRAFQLREGLTQTGELDSDTRARLNFTGPALTNYLVESSDL